METLITALTEPGARLAARLGRMLNQADPTAVRLLLPERLHQTALTELEPPATRATGETAHLELTTYEGGLGVPLARWFTAPHSSSSRLHDPIEQQRRLLFIGATGIVIRLIAPHLRDKHSDPAVLVVDEAGRFVIPLLGGHIGGANAFGRQVAALLQAQLALTTASDVQGSIAVDLLGHELGWRIEAEPGALRRAARCVVDGLAVVLIEEACGREWWTGPGENPPPNIHCLPSLEAALAHGLDQACAVLWITRRAVDADLKARLNSHLDSQLGERLVLYRPLAPPSSEGELEVTVGVGCDRGAALETVAACVDAALKQLGSVQVRMLASVTQKQDEPGILTLAALRGWPTRFYPASELAEIPVANPSETVRQVLGTPAVAEAAALRAANAELKDLLIEKQTHRGSDGKHATVALARFHNHSGAGGSEDSASWRDNSLSPVLG